MPEFSFVDWLGRKWTIKISNPNGVDDMSNECQAQSYDDPSNVFPIPQKTEQKVEIIQEEQEVSLIRSYFERAVTTMVEFSKLSKDVAELREVVRVMKVDLETLQRTNHYLTEEVNELREKRRALQEDNAALRNNLALVVDEKSVVERQRDNYSHDIDAMTNTISDLRHSLAEVTKDRNDVNTECLQLQEKLKQMEEAHRVQLERADGHERTLGAIRSAFDGRLPQADQGYHG
jgi:chromosome segregation ATPase